MVRLKILYNRKDCISAWTCVQIDPKNWQRDSDGDRADLTGSKLIDETKQLYEKIVEVDEKTMQTVIEGAKSCPTAVIKVVDADTGQVYVEFLEERGQA